MVRIYLLVIGCLIVSACQFVVPFRPPIKQAKDTDRLGPLKTNAAEQQKEILGAINSLKLLTLPISKKIGQLNETDPQPAVDAAVQVESDLKLLETEKKSINAFSLAYELFKEMSLGNLSISGSEGSRFFQEFESLRARRFTGSKVRVYLTWEGGLDSDDQVTDSKNLNAVLQYPDGSRKNFILIDSGKNTDGKNIAGKRTIVDLAQLDNFLAEYSLLMKGYRAERMGGKIRIISLEGGGIRLESEDFYWGDERSIQRSSLNLEQTKNGEYVRVDIQGQSKISDSKTLKLRVDVDERLKSKFVIDLAYEKNVPE